MCQDHALVFRALAATPAPMIFARVASVGRIIFQILRSDRHALANGMMADAEHPKATWNGYIILRD
jgi:hypothetical protein